MVADQKTLGDQPFLADMPPDFVKKLAHQAAEEEFEGGDYLFHQNEEASQFYIIQGGTVSLKVFVPHRGPVPIQTLGVGEVLGWSWLIPPYKWHFDARALEYTQVLRFDGRKLRDEMRSDACFGYDMLERFINIIAHRLQATRLQLLDVYGTV